MHATEVIESYIDDTVRFLPRHNGTTWRPSYALS